MQVLVALLKYIDNVLGKLFTPLKEADTFTFASFVAFSILGFFIVIEFRNLGLYFLAIVYLPFFCSAVYHTLNQATRLELF